MSDLDTIGPFRFFRRTTRTPDYRLRLEERGARHEPSVLARKPAHAARIRELAGTPAADTVVFQGVVVTALKVLQRVHLRERRAADAAISLAQREKLQEMLSALEETEAVLWELLSKRGAQMQMLHAASGVEAGDDEPSWWFALTEAIQVLDEGTRRIRATVAGQQRGDAARILGGTVLHLLRNHYAALLTEAEQWMQG